MVFASGRMARYVVLVVGTLVAVTSMGVNLSALLAASAVILVGLGFGILVVASTLAANGVLSGTPTQSGQFGHLCCSDPWD